MNTTMPLTAEELSDLQDTLELAGPTNQPPWSAGGDRSHRGFYEVRGSVGQQLAVEVWERDADLIVAAVNALPALLAEVAESRAKLARLEALATTTPNYIGIHPQRLRAALAAVKTPSRITVTVTAEDVEHGKSGNCSECALALALIRQFGDGWSVGMQECGRPVAQSPDIYVDYVGGIDLEAAVLEFDGVPHELPPVSFPGTFTLQLLPAERGER